MSIEKEKHYSAAAASSSSMAPGVRTYPSLPEFISSSVDQHHHDPEQYMKARDQTYEIPQHKEPSSSLMVDYMLSNDFNHHHHQHQQEQASLLGYSDVMQLVNFSPNKLGQNQSKLSDEEAGIDPVYFLKFPVLNNDKLDEDGGEQQLLAVGDQSRHEVEGTNTINGSGQAGDKIVSATAAAGEPSQAAAAASGKNKRKRGRAVKTSEEVESQRMTHIAVERNRRKQMNEHLRVLRSLMPGSYVQRGDQASIIGGSIEFVRELEQLLQCLESQKRRRLYGDNPPATRTGDVTTTGLLQQPQQQQQQQHPMMFRSPTSMPGDIQGFGVAGDQEEEVAENKSCLADVEVKVLGFDAMIKILSRRRPGQLIRTIAALEDLQFLILHTNITTIEQTVLYSFNVKVASETRYSAEDIASSVQQIFSFIHANSSSSS